MSETGLERDMNLIKILENVMELYNKAINMEYEKQQRLILKYLITVTKPHKELICVTEACEKVNEEYSESMPRDNTLLQEAMDLVKVPYKNVFPLTFFDEDMIVYKMYDYLIKDLFDSIPKEEFKQSERMTIDNLWKTVHCTLVDNPNFKGDNPYYKRNYSDMDRRAKKLWIKLLDDRFNNCIEYFKEIE